MAIQYRTPKKESLNGDPKSLALAKEEQAYLLEIEVKRQEALSEGHPDRADLEGARTKAQDARLFALIATKALQCQQDEIKDIRVRFLDRWLEQVEEAHRNLTELLDQAETVLSMNGDAELASKEREAVVTKKNEWARTLADVEVSWSVITTEMDNLGVEVG